MEIKIIITCADDKADAKKMLSTVQKIITKELRPLNDVTDLLPVRINEKDSYGSYKIDIDFED